MLGVQMASLSSPGSLMFPVHSISQQQKEQLLGVGRGKGL